MQPGAEGCISQSVFRDR